MKRALPIFSIDQILNKDIMATSRLLKSIIFIACVFSIVVFVFDVLRNDDFVDEDRYFGNSIVVVEPLPQAEVMSPLHVLGHAEAVWFKDKKPSLTLYTLDKVAIGTGDIVWIEEGGKNRIRFIGEIDFDIISPMKGFIEISTGEGELASTSTAYSIQIPVVLKSGKGTTTSVNIDFPKDGACIRTGCSGTICSREHVVTTCEFKESYACYTDAVCEEQSNGICGWTENESLRSCLSDSTQ